MIELLLSTLLLFDVRGSVVDPNGMAVPGAAVTCNKATTQTNDQGQFQFPGVASCAATVTKSGFAEQTASLEADKDNSVTLTLASLSESVLITAGGAEPISIDQAGVAADVVTGKEIEERQFAPVSDILRDIPGIDVVQTGSGGGITNIFTRGGDSNATLVMLDGVPLTDPGGNIDIVSLTSQGLDRIEVVRGPESTLYGAEASSGVIQLFSKEGDPEATWPHGSVSYERGSFSTDHWSAGIDGGFLKKFDYALTADQYRTTGEYPNNAFRNTTGTANIGYRFSSATTLRAIYREWDSYTGIPGQTFYGLYDYLANQLVRDSALTVRLDDSRGSRYVQHAYLAYHRNRNISVDNSNGSEAVTALLQNTSGPDGPQTYFVGVVPNSTTVAPPGLTLSQQTNYFFPYYSLALTDRLSGNYQGTLVHPGGGLTFGYDYERQAGIITGTNVTRTDNGVTLFDQFAFAGRVFLSGGLRVEHSSVYGTYLAPRGAVSFRLPTNTYFRVSGSHGVLEPSLLENYSYSPAEGFVGNPALKPEKTNTFEAGLQREWLSRRIKTEASYFRNRYTDLIEFTFATSPGTWMNVDQAWARGVELSGSARLVSALNVHASYTYLQSEDLSTGQELLRRPRNSGTTYLDYSKRRWTLMAGARFVGQREDNDYLFGVTRSRAYEYVYLNGSFQATKHVAPFLRINNLTNQIYQEALGYASWSRNASGGVRVTW